MKTIIVKTEPDAYPVRVGAGLLDRLPALMHRDLSRARRCVIATDSFLARSLGVRAQRAFRAAGWKAELFALPRGEAAKSLASVERFFGFLLRAGVERRTPVVALGGGTVGDAAGFAASAYYRGVPLIQVPTTLLAQVDSAIGGKTAVNHPLAKNAIGSFYQPRLVVCDTAVLKSLPRREFLSGLGEVVKYALLFDRAFARRLSADWNRLCAFDEGTLEAVVARCAALKARVVAADTRDLSGTRELLNFGHTLGHALEKASGYGRVRHGEAVAWGMRAAAAISFGRGWTKDKREIDALLARLPRVRIPAGLSRRGLLAPLKLDKKAVGGRNVFVLLKGVGNPVRVADVSPAEIDAAIDAVEGA
ncbi:MAG: 3-dehydroquinate synthase [Elusimicrobia bacterium CG_4_9_14_3_um_filter_62_55]|nr:MAG: 3-dehydroquinate synthase [Elusimicrobia bacterium CG22_combo_CG10-13_8_21_14_all_63_91]PJA12808.1 MAG: 3-dehydroquinate synthase [Elusimicrobia bacterium CG_4_10_14_0_2_um_filter_63_34]PJB23024.1 MAG: 3-dehydroquinate synthase [Elusimicrobia bacterium CG_4_9_14_3_um_filter_62_55]